MDKEEYKFKKSEISRIADEALSRLRREYAFSNSNVSIGDEVEDHSGRIVVDKILIASEIYGYEGVNLTRKGTPNKRDPRRVVYQCNLKRIISK